MEDIVPINPEAIADGIPVDVTLKRPEVIAQTGRLVVTKQTIRLSAAGSVDNGINGPDQVTVSGAICGVENTVNARGIPVQRFVLKLGDSAMVASPEAIEGNN